MPSRRSFMACAGIALAASRRAFSATAAGRNALGVRWVGTKSTKMRGLNCLQPFGYGTVKNGSYVENPYQNGGTDLQVMPDARLRLIRTTGFDFVRMCIDPVTLATAVDTNQLTKLIDQIKAGISRRLAAGLRVIADLHVVGEAPIPGWSNKDVATGLESTKFQRYAIVAQELAAAIEELNAPAEVSIELFNEPPPDAEIKGDPWPHVQAPYLWRAVRSAAPRSTLLIGGSSYNSISGLIALDPSLFDFNTLFVFHGYTPLQVTLQGSDGDFRYIHALSFPPDPAERSNALRQFSQSVDADKNLSAFQKSKLILRLTKERINYGLDTYFDEPQDRSFIAGQFKIATDWADFHRLPRGCIINGESGCNGDYNSGLENVLGANLGTRVNVIRALCQAGDEAGMNGYVVHELQGSGFAISDPATFEFVPQITDAMGI